MDCPSANNIFSLTRQADDSDTKRDGVAEAFVCIHFLTGICAGDYDACDDFKNTVLCIITYFM